MILAGLSLIAVGAVDLIRRVAARRAVRLAALGALAAAIAATGALSDAVIPALIALLVGGAWLRMMPLEGAGPASVWPAVVLAGLVASTTAFMPHREAAGIVGDLWRLPSPVGEISFDVAVLAVGAVLIVAETGNLIVRAALDQEGTWRPVEAAGRFRGGHLRQPQQPDSGFQGGRLIGPLERLLVLALTLSGAYPILAAMLAAKGIVRFPEISKDGETGARAEYFLVGSLVSWVIALAAAFLLWWAVRS